MYTMQLISCTLVSEPRINMMDPTICWGLGQSLSWGLIRCRGQQLGIGSIAHTEHIVLKAAIGENDKYEASLKIEGRKNLFAGPMGLHGYQCASLLTWEMYRIYHQKKKKKVALSYFLESNTNSLGIQARNPKVRVKRFRTCLEIWMLSLYFEWHKLV